MHCLIVFGVGTEHVFSQNGQNLLRALEKNMLNNRIRKLDLAIGYSNMRLRSAKEIADLFHHIPHSIKGGQCETLFGGGQSAISDIGGGIVKERI